MNSRDKVLPIRKRRDMRASVTVHLPCVRACARHLDTDNRGNLQAAGVCAGAQLRVPVNTCGDALLGSAVPLMEEAWKQVRRG